MGCSLHLPAREGSQHILAYSGLFWLIALAVFSYAPTLPRLLVLSRRASAVAHRSALAAFTVLSPPGTRNRALPRRWRRTKRSAIRADCCPGWRCRRGWRRDRR